MFNTKLDFSHLFAENGWRYARVFWQKKDVINEQTNLSDCTCSRGRGDRCCSRGAGLVHACSGHPAAACPAVLGTDALLGLGGLPSPAEGPGGLCWPGDAWICCWCPCLRPQLSAPGDLLKLAMQRICLTLGQCNPVSPLLRRSLNPLQ